jgi:hypothetical protein
MAISGALPTINQAKAQRPPVTLHIGGGEPKKGRPEAARYSIGWKQDQPRRFRRACGCIKTAATLKHTAMPLATVKSDNHMVFFAPGV